MLKRKLVRDLWRAKWQYLAVAVMVLLGVAFYNGSYSTFVNLRTSYQRSFDELRFEHFGIAFHAAPERVAERLRRLENVEAVEGRLVEDVAIEIPGAQKRLMVGRLISIPTDRELRVNRLKIISGTPLRAASSREVLLEASFAAYHELKPGDFIIASRGPSRARLRIAGIVQSDEYLYVVRSKQELISTPDTFGVMFMSHDVLGPLVGKGGSFNELRVRVADVDRLHATMAAATRELQVYRPDEPVAREDQPSYQMLEQDLEGFRMYAVMFPVLFLSVAAVTVYTLLMRMVHQQRSVIGLMRSLGFSSASVVRHYLAAAMLIGIVGSAIGTAAGIWLAGWVSRLYMSMLQLPVVDLSPKLYIVVVGAAIGVLTCLLAGIFPARAAAAIQPADAMRPVTPSFGRKSVQLDRLFPSASLLWRIPLRNVFRQPKRTVSTLFGVVMGVTLMMLAKGLLDSSSVAIEELVSGAFRYDMRVSFLRNRTHADARTVGAWPGVVLAEGVLDVPVDFEHEGREYSALLSGLEPGSRLTRLRDTGGRALSVTERGAILGPTLRKRLGLQVGDMISVRLPDEVAKEPPREHWVRVAGFNDEAMGTVAYLPLAEVQRIFRTELELPPNAINSVLVKARPEYAHEIEDRLLALTDAASVTSMTEMRKMIYRMMETMRRFVWIMQAFGAALAFAMVFNMVTINVLERLSEVATLRTIGASRSQVALAIVAENMLVALIGVAIGLPVGRLFVHGFWRLAQTEEQQDLFNFQISILPETYVMAIAVILIVTLVSQVPSLLSLSKLDLAKAVKERSS